MTAQTTWLKNQLIAARAAGSPILWIVASWHEPYYTCGEHSGDMDPSFTYFWPLFDQYGVDLILNGHDHSYQRFKPINRTVSTTAPVSAYGAQTGQGRCEIICGGAGAPLYTQESTVATPFLQTFQSINNFVTCDVTGCSGAKETKIHITAYNSTGTMIDSLTLSKACPLTTGIEPNSRPVFNPIKVIPNPVSDKMTLRYSSALQGEAIIEIHDTQGKKIRTEKVGKFQQDLEYTIDVSHYGFSER
jgi:hypothetical protein